MMQNKLGTMGQYKVPVPCTTQVFICSVADAVLSSQQRVLRVTLFCNVDNLYLCILITDTVCSVKNT